LAEVTASFLIGKSIGAIFFLLHCVALMFDG
jgi:hypothetical protein